MAAPPLDEDLVTLAAFILYAHDVPTEEGEAMVAPLLAVLARRRWRFNSAVGWLYLALHGAIGEWEARTDRPERTVRTD